MALTLAVPCLAQINPPALIPTNGLPSALAPVVQAFQSLPTTSLDKAKLVLDVGAYNGQSLAGKQILQNYLAADYFVRTNVFVGAEVRNVFNQIDYLGMQAGYAVTFNPQFQFAPAIGVGYSLDEKALQASFQPLRLRYQPGGPTLHASVGYDTFFKGGASSGSLSARAGISFAF